MHTPQDHNKTRPIYQLLQPYWLWQIHFYRQVGWLAGLCLGFFILGAKAEDINILQLAPLSGNNGAIGFHMQVGAQIYFDEVNAHGGINGRRLKLITVDDATISGPPAVQELITKLDPLALYGLVGPERVESLLQAGVIDGAQIPVVGTRTGAASLIDSTNPLLFMTRTSYAEEISAIFRQLATTGVKKIAVFHPNDSLGEQLLRAARDAAAQQGLQIVVATGHVPDAATPDAAVLDILKVPHQAVLLTGGTLAVATFIQNYRQRGGTGQLIALSSAEGAQLALLIGAERTYGVNVSLIAPSPRNLTLSVVRDFLADFRRYGPKNAEPTTTMMESYLGARVLAEGLRRAGPLPSRAKLAKALSGLTDYDVGGVVFSYGGNSRTASHYVDISVLDRSGHLLR